MATTIPKLITNTDKYFQYEGTANPTTQDELQAYMKNEHSVVECLTDALWQPETVYTIGHIVKSPNMPKGFQAVCLVNGTSSSNEPDWGTGGTDITDGSTKWEVTTAHVTVNGVSPDESGNISITSVTNATNATKATQDSVGQQINTTYIKGLSVSGKVITYTRGNGATGTITTQDTTYSLPTASSSTLGGVKVGSGLSISNGVLSVSGGVTAYKIPYATCSTGNSTKAKVATVSNSVSFSLATGTICVVKYTNRNTHYPKEEDPTLNINSRYCQ